MKEEIADTHSKALRINLDPRWYGTFAEIGAGQEVVRWFFRVGGAAGTIAKSISAYDMQVSDAIYGRADRYVSLGRLQGVPHRGFQLDVQRPGPRAGGATPFPAPFRDSRRGWLRFRPRAPLCAYPLRTWRTSRPPGTR